MTKKADWEKEFDKKFPYGGMIIEDDGSRYTFDDIKAFIRSLLSQQRQEILMEIDEISSRPIVRRYSIDNLSILGRRWDAYKLLSGDITGKNYQEWLGIVERFMDCHRLSDWDKKTLSVLVDKIQEYEERTYPSPKSKLTALCKKYGLEVSKEKK
jgi:hypothetical protein